MTLLMLRAQFLAQGFTSISTVAIFISRQSLPSCMVKESQVERCWRLHGGETPSAATAAAQFSWCAAAGSRAGKSAGKPRSDSWERKRRRERERRDVQEVFRPLEYFRGVFWPVHSHQNQLGTLKLWGNKENLVVSYLSWSLLAAVANNLLWALGLSRPRYNSINMKRVWKKSSYSIWNWTYPRLTELRRRSSCGGLDGGGRAKPHSKHSTAAWTAASSLSTSPVWQKHTDLPVLTVSVYRSRVAVEESAVAAGGWQHSFDGSPAPWLLQGTITADQHFVLKGPERSSRRSTTVPHCVCLGLDVWRRAEVWKSSGTWLDSEWIIYATKKTFRDGILPGIPPVHSAAAVCSL